MTTLRERVAIAICDTTSGLEGPPGMHECECKPDGVTECADMLRAADAAIEECAKVCDGYAKRSWAAKYPSQEAAVAAENLAKALRSQT
jgi:hypothetical protein